MKNIKKYKIFEAKAKMDWEEEIRKIVKQLEEMVESSGIDKHHFHDIFLGLLDYFDNQEYQKVHIYKSILLSEHDRVSLTDNETYEDHIRITSSDYKPWNDYTKLKNKCDKLSSQPKLFYEYRIFISQGAYDVRNRNIKDKVNSELLDIEYRCKSEGIEYKFEKISDSFDIRLKKELDPSKFKISKGYHNLIPNNVLDRFEEFVNRKSLPEKDRLELANIIKDAK